MKRLESILTAGAAAMVVGFSPLAAQDRDPGDPVRPDSIRVERYELEGQVATRNPGDLTITINAEAIDMGEAGAMTVPYVARDSAEFEKFQVDDWVVGELVVDDNRTYVENLRLASEEEVKDEEKPEGEKSWTEGEKKQKGEKEPTQQPN